MAHPEELLAAILSRQAEAHLRRGHAVPWTDLEGLTRCDLTGRSDHRSRARFTDGDEADTMSPETWLETLEDLGAGRVELRPIPAEDANRRVVRLAGEPLREHVLRAFAGSGGVLLAASVGERRIQHRTRVWLPPETTLTASDVLAFVASQRAADDLRDAILWEDAHNLHVTDGKDWGRFVAALRPEFLENLVRAMSRVVGNVRFTHGEAEAWVALKRSRKNPDFAWQFDFVRVEDGVGPWDAVPVVEQTERLRRALVDIEAFARGIDETGWADGFRSAIDLLGGAASEELVVGGFGGTGMGQGATRLLGASLRADVFGGMGSWNDLAPADREKYGRVSDDLSRELLPSLLSAVNDASAPAA
jgi:hypothetical protein